MRIKQVTEEKIVFDNGNEIFFNHRRDCCETNYADFCTLNENNINYNYNFDENLIFEAVDELGFKFGSNERWIFIPCYSEQNGYYTSEIDIYYKKEKEERIERVLRFDAQEILY